jgi:hypothetical protein
MLNCGTVTLSKLKPQILDKVTSYLTIAEIEELCLVDKTTRINIFSIAKIKIRVLEAKVKSS